MTQRVEGVFTGLPRQDQPGKRSRGETPALRFQTLRRKIPSARPRASRLKRSRRAGSVESSGRSASLSSNQPNTRIQAWPLRSVPAGDARSRNERFLPGSAHVRPGRGLWDPNRRGSGSLDWRLESSPALQRRPPVRSPSPRRSTVPLQKQCRHSYVRSTVAWQRRSRTV